jgi:hypothetical protein
VKVRVNDRYELEVPDVLIDKFFDDFETLPGGKNYESVCILRDLIEEVFDVFADDPEMLEEDEYKADFIKAIAMREALIEHGIFYDA